MKKGITPTIWILVVAIIAIIVAYILISMFGANIGAAGEQTKTAIGDAGKGLIDIISSIK